MKIELPSDQLNSAKLSFTCRRVDLLDARCLIREPYQPEVGDIVLATVEQLGQHKRIELDNGRRATIEPGDLVILAYGNRYAPDQFEGVVPYSLSSCSMIAAGGIAATEITRHRKMVEATKIRPVGVLADEQGKALNLSDYRLPDTSCDTPRLPLFVSCGTSMNSGKTHTACSLIRGLTAMGYSVGAIKITGTGAGGDLWRMWDSGAKHVLDFTDAGMPSTYLASQEALLEVAELLLDRIATDSDVNVVVAEIADGVSHPETGLLLQSSLIKSRASGVLFAAGDALGAYSGYRWLRDQQLPILGICGTLALSPLAMRELSALVPVNPLTSEELTSPTRLQTILPESFVKASAIMQLPAHAQISSPVGDTDHGNEGNQADAFRA
ncbi:MAG: hypothetical protein MI756_15155 [Chromatiales bacterium]|nr:hypothetical protein [Chromatiales bacterium]